MESLQSKLKTLGITESNSNHILENNSHSVKVSKNENIENTKKAENGHQDVCEELAINGSQSPCIKSASNQTSTENEESTELSEISQHHPLEVNSSPKCPELEVIEVLRELPDKTNELFKITYKVYESELELPSIMKLIQKDLSEPYSIYTYRYFIHNWGHLCYLALHENKCVGCIVCKLDVHRQMIKRGYIAMLAVDKDYRKLKIGTTLVQKAIRVMIENQADEVVLETEITNQPALRLYENLGFVRDKRLFHYYLNGVDALRLKLWFR
jgi:peptide alpha-N-acetyltransferase